MSLPHEITPHRFLSQVHANTRGPVYLFLGEEALFRDSCLAALKHVTLDDTCEAFNYDLVFAEDTNAQDILARCKTFPILTSHRLVAVKHIEKLDARSLDTLQAYVLDPVSSTCLALLGSKLNNRSKATQTLKRCAVVVDCAPLHTREITHWIRQYSSNIGLRLDEPTVDLIASACGRDLYTAKHEIDKLATYVSPHKQASLNDAHVLLTGTTSDSVFAICDAIGDHNPGSALPILQNILEAGEPPLRLLALLSTQFRQLWTIQALTSNGVGRTKHTAGTLAKTTGLSPFRVRSLLRHAHQFSTAELKRAFVRIAEADARLKGVGGQTPAHVLEALVLSLCHKCE